MSGCCSDFTGDGFTGGGGGPCPPCPPTNCCGEIARSIWDTPEIPNADDDEFLVGPGLDPAWTVREGAISASAIDPYAAFAAGGARLDVNQRRPSWLMVQPQTAQFTITKLFVPAATYSVFARFSFNHRSAVAASNNDFTVGLTLTTNPFDTNNRLDIFLNESDVGVIQVEFARIVGGVVSTIGTTINKPANDHTVFEGVLIQRTAANTYHGWAITNNGSALWVGTTTTFTPTIGQAGIRFTNATTVAPGNAILGCDFFRRNDGALFLP